MTRVVAAPLLAIAFACAGTGSPPTPTVSHDRVSLARKITVPDLFPTATWAGRVRGAVGLGPTDVEVVAWLPSEDTAALDALLGPVGAEVALGVPPELTAAVGRPSDRGTAVPCAPFETSLFACFGAVRQDGGVLVWAGTR